MRAGKMDRAIKEYVQRWQIQVPIKLFRPQILANVRDVVVQGIRDELDDVHADDAGRNFYLFLMRNEQRRKQRPRLLAVAILWTLALTALAFGSSYLHP